MQFVSHKYELIYLTTVRTRHSLQTSILIGRNEKLPSKEVRVLGVWLGLKLKWSAYANIV
jgi:hypothetical protein